MTSIIDLMRLLQFGDSMLPVGAFAFSNGLEAAIQQRVVVDVDSLSQFVQTALGVAATTDGGRPENGLIGHFGWQTAKLAGNFDDRRLFENGAATERGSRRTRIRPRSTRRCGP